MVILIFNYLESITIQKVFGFEGVDKIITIMKFSSKYFVKLPVNENWLISFLIQNRNRVS